MTKCFISLRTVSLEVIILEKTLLKTKTEIARSSFSVDAFSEILIMRRWDRMVDPQDILESKDTFAFWCRDILS